LIYDYIVISSGFGRSVASLCLVEKGYKVLTLKQGKRFHPENISKQLILLEKEWQMKTSG
jgi:choline dehydrogenase-like flavoprotein